MLAELLFALIILGFFVFVIVAALVAFYRSKSNQERLENHERKLQFLWKQIKGNVSQTAQELDGELSQAEPPQTKEVPVPAQYQQQSPPSPEPPAQTPAPIAPLSLTEPPQPIISAEVPVTSEAEQTNEEEYILLPLEEEILSEENYLSEQEQPIAETSYAVVEPVETISLEERLGTRFYVWIGGVAIALSAAFLMHHLIVNNHLTLVHLLWTAIAAGFALIGLSELVRERKSHVPQALCGAGLSTLYASILGAHYLEAIQLSLTSCFVLMALVTAAAVFLSLRHGQFVAILGLVGGFLMPIIVRPEAGSGIPLLIYFLMLEVGLLAISKRRRWYNLVALTLLGVIIWGAAARFLQIIPADGVQLHLFLIISTMIYAFYSLSDQQEQQVAPFWSLKNSQTLSYISLICSLVLMSLFIFEHAQFKTLDFGMYGLLGLGAVLLGYYKKNYKPLAWVASILAWITLLGFGISNFAPDNLKLVQEPKLFKFLTIAACYFGIFGFTSFLFSFDRMRGGKNWAIFSTIQGAIMTCLVTGRLYFSQEHSLSFLHKRLASFLPEEFFGATGELQSSWFMLPMVPLFMMALYIAFAMVQWGFRKELASENQGFTSRHQNAEIYLFLAALFLPLACLVQFDYPWFTTAWIGVALLYLWIQYQWKLPSLQHIAGGLAGITTILLVIPGPFEYALADHEFSLWGFLIPHYGVPLLAVLGMVLFYHWRIPGGLETKRIAWVKELSAWLPLPILFLSSLYFTQYALHEKLVPLSSLLHHFHRLSSQDLTIYISLWIGLGLGLLAVQRELKHVAFTVSMVLFNLVAISLLLIGPCLFKNPLWYENNIATQIIWNDLLFIYGLPALLFGLASWRYQQDHQGASSDSVTALLAKLTGVSCFFLLFLTVSLEIRHIVHQGKLQIVPENVVHENFTLHELATYTICWLLISCGILALRRYVKHEALDYGYSFFNGVSLLVMLLGPCLLLNPLWNQITFGKTPIFNQILYIYALPGALFGIVSWRSQELRGIDEKFHLMQKQISQMAGALCLLLLFLTVGLEVRHYFHREDLTLSHGLLQSFSAREVTTYSICWLLIGFGLLYLRRQKKHPLLDLGIKLFNYLAFGLLIFFSTLLMNPLWYEVTVGETKIVNGLLYLYGLPVLLTGLVIWRYQRLDSIAKEDRAPFLQIRSLAGAVCLILVFTLISLEVRQWFAGTSLQLQTTKITSQESLSYSIAWVSLGLFLLGLGLCFRSATVRYGSLIIMLLAIGKVFLVDTANLGGLARVGSFLGLGVSLIILGFIYQRFVFRKQEKVHDD